MAEWLGVWPVVEGGDKACCWPITIFPTIPAFPGLSPSLLLTYSGASADQMEGIFGGKLMNIIVLKIYIE